MRGRKSSCAWPIVTSWLPSWYLRVGGLPAEGVRHGLLGGEGLALRPEARLLIRRDVVLADLRSQRVVRVQVAHQPLAGLVLYELGRRTQPEGALEVLCPRGERGEVVQHQADAGDVAGL